MALESEGLMLALSELSANTQRLFNIGCDFVCDGPFLIDENSTATHLYRIVQEAINNAIKHGKAKNVTISFRSGAKMSTLAVIDDGIGIGSVPAGKGMGLSIMNYRASMIGATVDARPGPDGGTVITCSFPTKRITE